MLSGRAPFHARSRDDSAAAIMSRIKGGEFHFNDEAWAPVSQQAKALTKGNHNPSWDVFRASTKKSRVFRNLD